MTDKTREIIDGLEDMIAPPCSFDDWQKEEVSAAIAELTRLSTIEKDHERLRGECVGHLAAAGIAMLAGPNDPTAPGEVASAIDRLAAERNRFRDVEPTKWLIWSNEYSAWWRDEASGYTTNIVEAGRFTFVDACRVCAVASYRCGSRIQPSAIPPETMAPESIVASIVSATTPAALAQSEGTVEHGN